MTSPRRCYVAMPFGRQRLPGDAEIDFDLVYELNLPASCSTRGNVTPANGTVVE